MGDLFIFIHLPQNIVQMFKLKHSSMYSIDELVSSMILGLLVVCESGVYSLP